MTLLAPVLALALTGMPGGPDAGPAKIELVKLYFIAGDVGRAVDVMHNAFSTDADCRAVRAPLVEYAALIHKSDRLTPAEAKAVIADDRIISPLAVGKLTQTVIDRFVTAPLVKAKSFAAGGKTKDALALIAKALEVDPANPEALALQVQLTPDAGVASLAGPTPDAGR